MSTGYKVKSIKDVKRENIRRINQKKAKLKLVGYVTIFVVAMILVGFLVSSLTKQSCLLRVGTIKIGYVENNEKAMKLIEEAKKSIEEEKGTEIKITIQPSIDSVGVANKPDDIEKIIDALKQQLDYDIKAYKFFVNDNHIFTLQSADAVNKVLNELKNKYDDNKIFIDFVGNNENLKKWFLEDITINTEFINKSNVIDIEDAVKLLEGTSDATEIYAVKANDTLSGIASRYDNVSTEDLYRLNPGIKEKALQIGQEIKIGMSKPVLSVVFKGEKTFEEVIPRKVTTQKNNMKLITDKKIIKEGKDGKKRVTANVEMINGIILKKEVITEETIEEPIEEIVEVGTKVSAKSYSGIFAMPTTGIITSKFGEIRSGYAHKGIDIANDKGTAIYAMGNGVITDIGYEANGYGNYIKIKHSNGFVSLYGHLSKTLVKEGEEVNKNTKIGNMGSTGRSTGSHLHFEIIKDGVKMNPLNYVK